MRQRRLQFGLQGLLLTTTACCIVFAGLSSAGAAMMVCLIGLTMQSVGFVALVVSTAQRPDRMTELQERVIEVGLAAGTLVTVFGVACRLLHLV